MDEKDTKKDENERPKLTKKESLIQALKFTLFSSAAGAIQFVTATLLDLLLQRIFNSPESSWTYYPSYFTGLVLSVIFNFTVNRKFTFKSANNVPVAMMKVFGYYCVFTPISLWLDYYPVTVGHWNHMLVLILTMLLNFVTEFLFDRFVVFGKSINTNEIAQKEREAKMKAEEADQSVADKSEKQ